MRLRQKNDAVFLISPIADTPWFRTCIRQADRIWYFARADARPSTPLLPPEDPSPARQFRLVDVILLHHGMDRKAATTDEWRVAAEAARLFHWRGSRGRRRGAASAHHRAQIGRACALRRRCAGLRAYRRDPSAARSRDSRSIFLAAPRWRAVIAACAAMGWDDNEIEYAHP